MSSKVLRAAMCAALLAVTAACMDSPIAGASGPGSTSSSISAECRGAKALLNDCAIPEEGDFKPTPDVAPQDYRGNGNKEGCWTDIDFKRFKSCNYGSKKAKRTVALVGNSHMAQYLKSFAGWTENHDLRVVTFLVPQCFAIDTKIDFTNRPGSKGLTERCYEWGQWAHKQAAALDPDLIVTSERTYRKPIKPLPEGKDATWRKGYRDYIEGWVDDGHRVLVVRDNPVPEFKVPGCLKKNPKRFSACAGNPQEWLPPDPLVQAAESLDSTLISVLDLSKYMCTEKVCPPVLGGLSVYRDHSHLSGTWVDSLEPFMETAFMKILKSRS